MKVAEKNRAKAPGGRRLATSFEAVIKVVERQIKIVDAQMRTIAQPRVRPRLVDTILSCTK